MDRSDKKKVNRRMTANVSKERAGPQAAKAGAPREDGMSPALQAHIGRHVRAMFDEVADEPIPDHLLRLLQDLDKSGEK